MFEPKLIKKYRLHLSVFFDINMERFILSLYSKKLDKKCEMSLTDFQDLSPYFERLFNELTK